MKSSRRSFLAKAGLVTSASCLPARWVEAKDLPADRKIKLRFAVASDLHYGQSNTPYNEFAENMVSWINTEKKEKGLDLFFINGDITHDKAELLTQLRDKHLKNLEVPYYCIKGNHDYVDENPDSPSQSWKKVWGYDANNTVEHKGFAFVMANTTVAAKSNVYLAADKEWLASEFKKFEKAPAIFSFIHIQQRKHNKDGWPAHGVGAADQVEKAEAVMDLLESTPNVRGVFHGHNHNEAKMWVSGQRRYFFDSHVGGSWGAPKGYRIVEVDDKHNMLTYQVDAEKKVELNRNNLPQSVKL